MRIYSNGFEVSGNFSVFTTAGQVVQFLGRDVVLVSRESGIACKTTTEIDKNADYDIRDADSLSQVCIGDHTMLYDDECSISFFDAAEFLGIDTEANNILCNGGIVNLDDEIDNDFDYEVSTKVKRAAAAAAAAHNTAVHKSIEVKLVFIGSEPESVVCEPRTVKSAMDAKGVGHEHHSYRYRGVTYANAYEVPEIAEGESVYVCDKIAGNLQSTVVYFNTPGSTTRQFTIERDMTIDEIVDTAGWSEHYKPGGKWKFFTKLNGVTVDGSEKIIAGETASKMIHAIGMIKGNEDEAKAYDPEDADLPDDSLFFDEDDEEEDGEEE